MRVGWGFDAHRFGGPGPLRLAGVVVDRARGLEGTSDADVVAHAVADALLGGAALGDLGTYFPSSDARWEGADSMELLRLVVERIGEAGFETASVDVTVIAETLRIASHREELRKSLAGALGLEAEAVSVKATSTDGLGMIGRDEGMAAVAVAVLR